MHINQIQVNFFYIVSLISLHLFLQSRTYKIIPDLDSAAHLYYAYLKNKKIYFMSSYCFGIKWILPRIYAILEKFFKNKFFDHRIVNTFAGLVVFLEFILLISPRANNFFEVWFLILILIINSMYINYQTSSTEFIDTPLIIMLVSIIPILPSNYFLVFPLLFIIFLGFTFKATNYVYIIPLFGFHFLNLYQAPILFSLLLIILFISLFFLRKIGLKGLNKYNKSRVIFHSKAKRFLIFNPFWVLINIFTSILIISQLELISCLTIIAAWICILSQRVLCGYFWYPIAILNIFFFIKLNLIYPKFMLFIGLIVLARLIASSFICIFTPKKYIEPFIRISTFGELNLSLFKNNENELKTINWIKKNIDKNKSIYLWGQKTSIPLACGLNHIGGTFYSHNHLFIWSKFRDIFEYTKNTINKNKPHYIIEAGIIKNFKFPENEYIIYQKIYEFNEIRIFEIRSSL